MTLFLFPKYIFTKHILKDFAFYLSKIILLEGVTY